MIKVLFLASNPDNVRLLRLDEEVRMISQKLRAAEFRDVELKSFFAVRPDDLQQALLEYKPHIVHFSGHGSKSGEIILMDNNRRAQPVSAEALRRLFTTLKDNIRVVVLNACYSKIQAAAIAEVIDCVVGMSDAILDDAAMTFSASFYRAIGFGRSVAEAFELGKTAIMLEGIPDALTPQLLTRPGIDPTSIHIISQSPDPYILPANRKMDLVDALLACRSFRDRQGRNAIVEQLPQEISIRIDRSDSAHIDAVNIVSCCMDFEGGLSALVEKVREFEGDTQPMRQVSMALRSAGTD